ncbi:MAG: PA14 domain-containing protein, partial [Planctomycetota bacterium]
MKRTSMVFTLLFVVFLPRFTQQALAAENEGISLSRLPAVVQEVVKREFTGARVTGIEDGEYEGIAVYEIEAETADGRDIQIEVGKDGTLYQRDEEVRLLDLPPAVLSVVRKEVGNVEPDGLKRLTEHGKVRYEVEAEVSGNEIGLKIGADGTILEKEGEGDDDSEDAAARMPGLIGGQFGSADFSRVQSLVRLSSLELKVTDNDGYGNEWSARWFGYVAGPADGEITFAAEGNPPMEMRIAGKTILAMKPGSGTGSMSMVKGQEYPIEISVVKEGGAKDCHFRIMWSWAGQEKVTVPAANLTHTAAQEQEWVQKAKEADDDDDDEEDERVEQIDISHYDFGLSPSAKPVSGLGQIDLSEAKIFVLGSRSKVLANAADMLHDEIEKRTRIRLDVATTMPGKNNVAILIGVGEAVTKQFSIPAGLEIPNKSDGYAIWIGKSKRDAATVCLAGHDERGALYAVGGVLRMLEMGRDKLLVDAGIKVATAPKYALRGHQMGYRAKTNSYDAWTAEMWEQYYRDMIVFGLNAVEIVPPVTDDLPDSPVMPLKPMDMMIAQSKLADDYGLEVWIWYPAMEFRGKKREKISPELMELVIKNRDDVLSKLPRVDAVFVPSGDPGEVHPRYLFPHMKEHKKVLNKYHPNA